ncbi:MAG: glycine zipper 2TM domain-containing protein [Gammaproteobacteria bacterium]
MNKLTIRTALATAVCGLLISAPAFANDYDDAWVYARVVRAEPIVREVRVREPRQVCEDVPVVERTHYRGGPAPGSVLVGAIVGGVIGHQFGSGRGNDAATVAGAMIGADHAARNSWRSGRVVEREVVETRCETVRPARYEERVTGYEVTYRYHGRLYHTRTREHPGRTIRVRVSVTPYLD